MAPEAPSDGRIFMDLSMVAGASAAASRVGAAIRENSEVLGVSATATAGFDSLASRRGNLNFAETTCDVKPEKRPAESIINQT
jgi:hypothetical protein